MKNKTSLQQLQNRLKEMFQFQNNDLNFGIFKIFKLKQKEIEKFIDSDLEKIVEEQLKNATNNEQKANLLELRLFLKGFNQDSLLENIEGNYKKIEGFIEVGGNGETEKLKQVLKEQRNAIIEGDLENKIYNYILNFFDLYYSEGDFGYNTRSLDTYKVEYDEDYNGSDIMFHWKHKGSYYIKSGNGFNSIKFNLEGKNISFILETNENSEAEEISQNNNRETEFKHYELNRIEKVSENNYKVIFNLAKTSTSKEEVFKVIYKEIFNIDLEEKFLFETAKSKGEEVKKAIFKSLGKDFGKIQDGNIKGFSQLKIKKDDLLKKYNTNLPRGEKLEAKSFDELNKSNDVENTIINLWSLDQKLNSFYIGNDSDFFIHKDLKGFLIKEKEKFIKNNILGDLDNILNFKIDNTALVIAKTFNNISSKIIDFLSAVEEFQKHIFEMKKKVLVSEYCITLDKISEDFYKEILENKEQIQEWEKLGFIEKDTKIDLEYLKNNQTLNIDTKFFDKDFKDKILASFNNLEQELNGTLINSDNFQALNLLKNKYRGKIKCIYIDPPYNTGGDGFIYKDSFKHSSWLSMMNDRLVLARELLTEDGVIFVSIGEEENANLEKLLKNIFGEENYIGNITRVTKKGGNKGEYIKPKKDNIIVSFKDKNKATYFGKKIIYENIIFSEEIFNGKKRKFIQGDIPYRAKLEIRPNQRYYIKCPDGSFIIPPGNVFPEKIGDGEQVTPVDNNDKCWSWSKERYLEEVKNNRFIFKKSENSPFLDENGNKAKWTIYKKVFDFELEDRKEILMDFLDKFPNSLGTKEIDGFNLSFSNPKPSNLINFLIDVVTNKSDIILDFFSGSGTTQQAVIELNKEDGGNRKYIGVEMGEYFDSVTKPRVQKVVYTSDWKNGKPENNKGASQIFKYQVLEQYEDVLDKLEEDKESFPEGLDLKYLYRKEEIKLGSSLNLRKPFSNKYVYGKAKKETEIDLVETYNYLQGYDVESIKTYKFNNKYYKVVKTGNTLVIWRDIEVGENDIENIKKIVGKYNDIETLEVNVEIYSLERDKFGMLEIGGRKYDIEIIDESLFNE